VDQVLLDEAEQTQFGKRLGAALGAVRGLARSSGFALYLRGDLGTGKTTMVRGILQGLGFSGSVRSPTYTLIEPYELGDWTVLHLDLYRLADPEELEYLGLRDFAGERALILVEWPERGEGMLPAPDLTLELEHLARGRRLVLRSASEAGRRALAGLLAGADTRGRTEPMPDKYKS
jgi:tRNA threonylcarbamoyladenosine biosynthesis protein TsaE